jgi:hypothetical protein
MKEDAVFVLYIHAHARTTHTHTHLPFSSLLFLFFSFFSFVLSRLLGPYYSSGDDDDTMRRGYASCDVTHAYPYIMYRLCLRFPVIRITNKFEIRVTLVFKSYLPYKCIR